MDPKFNLVVTRRQVLGLGAAAATTFGLAACGSSSSSSDSSASGSSSNVSGSSSSASSEDVTQLTVTPGTLTVATGDPAYTPWVLDDDPSSGKGFEAALIYKLAEKLGFQDDQVNWIRTTFDEAYAPGDHDWDLNIQQVSINDDRKNAVDFSPAYFRPTQSFVTTKSSKYASAKSVADIKDAVIGVMVGSTAYDFVKSIVKGGSEDGIEVYNDNSAAAQAVSSGQADALVTDTPQAVYMVQSDEVTDGVVVGQIPGTEDQYGLGICLPKGSKLTQPVTDAMNALIDDGTVKSLQDQWLAEYTTDIPTLSE